MELETTILAYLDPGTGSIILQAAAAAVLSCAAVFRHSIRGAVASLLAIFVRKPSACAQNEKD